MKSNDEIIAASASSETMVTKMTVTQTENQQLFNIISGLEELQDDSMTPKNVKTKIEEIVILLKNGTNDPLVINRTLDELDQLTSDYNLDSFTRTQIFNIMSLMELVQ